MGQILHRNARTTESVRREIQLSKESIAVLSDRFGLNPKTVACWKKRNFTHDAKMGRKNIGSVLSPAEEQAVVAFRQLTQLPLDDTLYALEDAIPHLTRSNLYRCLKRNGCSKPERKTDPSSPKKSFKKYPIGFFHADIAEVQTAQGRLYLFVAIDRTSKFAYAKLFLKATRHEAAAFLEELIDIVPYKINKILTDNGIQFTNKVKRKYGFDTMFDKICFENDIEHRLTKIKHPWTNGQVERMNRTIKEATVKTYYYETHEQLESHLRDFLTAYNFAKRLKTLKGKTPWQIILEQHKINPKIFKNNNVQNYAKLNN
jgi:hypothetical protein